MVYCIDPAKRERWHLHLCAFLQELLGLPELPHFLVPCYAATIDRWLDPHTHQVRTVAEAARPLLKYQALMNVVFGTPGLSWQGTTWRPEVCDPLILATHRQQFPQLWLDHDLIARLEHPGPNWSILGTHGSSQFRSPVTQTHQGYVLRLFVSGHGRTTEKTLHQIHKCLENHLNHPYTLKVIDVLKYPEQAEANQISATPTLVQVWPPPVRRIVGILSADAGERVLQVLGSFDPGPENSVQP